MHGNRTINHVKNQHDLNGHTDLRAHNEYIVASLSKL